MYTTRKLTGSWYCKLKTTFLVCISCPYMHPISGSRTEHVDINLSQNNRVNGEQWEESGRHLQSLRSVIRDQEAHTQTELTESVAGTQELLSRDLDDMQTNSTEVMMNMDEGVCNTTVAWMFATYTDLVACSLVVPPLTWLHGKEWHNTISCRHHTGTSVALMQNLKHKRLWNAQLTYYIALLSTVHYYVGGIHATLDYCIGDTHVSCTIAERCASDHLKLLHTNIVQTDTSNTMLDY